MKHVFVVFDKVTGLYGNPVFIDDCPNVTVSACRWFANGVKALPPESDRVASDYDFFQLGKYSALTGTFELTEKPVFLCSGVAVPMEVKKDE